MKVVHCKREDYNTYIGRGKCPKTGRVSKWGNPFIIGKHGDRDEVISKYEAYIMSRPDLIADLHELRGKVLGCWCSPKACHGDILVRMVEDELWTK